MDKSGATLLDLEIDDSQMDAAAQLQFQEFPTTKTAVAELDVKTSAKDHTVSFPSAQNAETGDDEDEAAQRAGPSFWTFQYYQQFFDVNTNQVKDRVIWSMFPRPSKSYLDHYIKPKPDLYGPFWVCITLVFSLAVSRNLVSYLQFAATKAYHWKYEFHTVSYAATVIFSYAWLIPIAVWGMMWWQGGQNKMTLLETICIYGYSLSIFIPVSILWVVQLSWLQWLLFALSSGLSGAVLVLSVWPAALAAGRHIALPMALIMLALHALLAGGFMIFFFHTTSISINPTDALATSQSANESNLSNSMLITQHSL